MTWQNCQLKYTLSQLLTCMQSVCDFHISDTYGVVQLHLPSGMIVTVIGMWIGCIILGYAIHSKIGFKWHEGTALTSWSEQCIVFVIYKMNKLFVITFWQIHIMGAVVMHLLHMSSCNVCAVPFIISKTSFGNVIGLLFALSKIS